MSSGTSNVAARRTPLQVRGDFPYASQCVYLNTAAAGLSWLGQGDAAAAFYDGAKAKGFNGMADWRVPADEASARIARLMGVNRTDVRFAGSTTEGLYLAMGAIPFKTSQEIVVAVDEFPSVVAACEHGPRERPTITRVAIPNEASREDAIIDAITTCTRAVALSQVHWVTGTRINLDRVAAACRRVDALLVVDGAQALGAVPVSLPENAMYAASVFKWLLSGFGLGVLVVGRQVAAALEPAVRGYSNPSPSRDLQYGHVNHPGIHALNGSLAYMEALGWDRIHDAVDGLWHDLHGALSVLEVTVVTPVSSHGGILSCLAPNAIAVKDALAHENIFIEERGGLLRISPHFYNTSDDIAAFAERLGGQLQR